MNQCYNIRTELVSMMNKNVLISFFLSLAVCLIGAFVNYRSFLSGKYLLWSLKMYGGEITIEYGFGWIVSHIYGMTPDSTTSHNLRFSPIQFILMLAVGTALFFLIVTLVSKFRKSH